MWSITQQKRGESAAPTSHHISSQVDSNRFAEWTVKHSTKLIEIRLFIYLPRNPSKCRKVLFSIHGRKRNANKYRNIFVDSLDKSNVLLIAPEIKKGILSPSTALTLGNMFTGTAARTPIPRPYWTFTLIEELFQFIKVQFPLLHSYNIFGHSAGGQFAYRFALFSNCPHLETTIVANPGWLTALDKSIKLPYGIKDIFSDDEIRRILSKKIVIISGEQDVLNDSNLRTTKRALQQGRNRHERCLSVFQGAQSLSKRLNTPFRWRLITSRDLGHSSKAASVIATPYLV